MSENKASETSGEAEIVERLKMWPAAKDGDALSSQYVCLLLSEAAETIQRLVAERDELRELFRKDGEDHARTIRDLTERHSARIDKYYEALTEARAERRGLRAALAEALPGIQECRMTGWGEGFVADAERLLGLEKHS